MTDELPSSPGECWQSDAIVAGDTFGEACARLRDKNPFDLNALDWVMAFVATELWDRGFSQTEIRQAFGQAAEDLKSYAIEERRGDH